MFDRMQFMRRQDCGRLNYNRIVGSEIDKRAAPYVGRNSLFCINVVVAGRAQRAWHWRSATS